MHWFWPALILSLTLLPSPSSEAHAESSETGGRIANHPHLFRRRAARRHRKDDTKRKAAANGGFATLIREGTESRRDDLRAPHGDGDQPYYPRHRRLSGKTNIPANTFHKPKRR